MELDPEVALILTYIVSIIMCNACIWEHTESKTLASIQLNAVYLGGRESLSHSRSILGIGVDSLQHDGKIEILHENG